MLNARSPSSKLEDGSDEATRYRSAKLFTPEILLATVVMLVFAPATVFMFVALLATELILVCSELLGFTSSHADPV